MSTDRFEEVVQGAWKADPEPYGPRRARRPLTMRAKVAIGVASAVVAGGGLIGYQAYSASAAASNVKAQEIAYKQAQLELERLRELNKVNDKTKKSQVSAAQQRQADVNKCIKSKEYLIGRGYNSPSYRDLVDDCQAQYSATTIGDDMQQAGASQDVATGDGGGSNPVSGGLFIGIAALGGVVLIGARRARRDPDAA